MRKISIAAAATALIVACAAPIALADKGGVPSDNKVANKLCQAEKQADKAAFEATYGAKHTMRECKRTHRGEAEATVTNAAQECRAERDADPVAFQDTYGTNENGKNAFGKCVSSKVTEDAGEEAEEFKNAAQECRGEREADPAAFQETHGTNENKKNAFGKCVSGKVKEEDAE